MHKIFLRLLSCVAAAICRYSLPSSAAVERLFSVAEPIMSACVVKLFFGNKYEYYLSEKLNFYSIKYQL